MYLKRIRSSNFRAFGDGTSGPALDWELSPGMNILVGENDAGKSAVIDAIRHVLWTTSFEFIRLLETDFHIKGSERATSLFIEATLSGLSPAQESSVLEWLTHEPDGTTSLVLYLQARRLPPMLNRRVRVEVVTRSGRNGIGPEVGAAVRNLVRATYLRPLRDAEAELQPGRQSRLSQILSAHKSISGQEKNDFDSGTPDTVPKNLVGLMAFAQHHLGEHAVIRGVESDINDNYLSKFSFVGDELSSRIQIAPDLALQPILERFELNLKPSAGIDHAERCIRGLGYNNALFMATELVLLTDGDELALLLVEEPEAHLHPQLQVQVQQLLESSSSAPEEGKQTVQVVMTTHSPSLVAGADIACMTIVHRTQLFSLQHGQTKLQKSDYDFLRRFIDATKANLFFARGVAIVEGPAEAILLPAIAAACGRSFARHGVSVVNVGSVGLYHYARILQRADDAVKMPIPVACITDRDIVPDVAAYVSKNPKRRTFESEFSVADIEARVKTKEDRAKGGSTIVCVSDCWTFEYDLALSGCAELLFKAVHLAKRSDALGERLAPEHEQAALVEADEAWKALSAAGHTPDKLAAIVYQPLQEKDASKAVAAQYAAQLLADGRFKTGDELFGRLPKYLQRALTHVTSAGVGE